MPPEAPSRKRKSQLVDNNVGVGGLYDLEAVLSDNVDDPESDEVDGADSDAWVNKGSETDEDDEDDEDDEETDDDPDQDSDRFSHEADADHGGAGDFPGDTRRTGADRGGGQDSDTRARSANYTVTTDANGGIRYEYPEIDPIYDSDDTDAQGPVNTIGNIPLSFYDSYPHIGYTIDGKKIMRPAAGEALDALLDSIEVPEGWTGLTDPATGKPLNLSRDELELLRRLQMNEVPEDGFDPYPEMVEWFSRVEEKMPLSAAPEPKRRFVPSRHEAKIVAKIVRAIREGRILPYKPAEEREREEKEKGEIAYYDLWAKEEARKFHVMNIPAPKLPPPGYDLSYNPPAEYLPTDAERQEWEKTEEEDREKEYLPARFDALRKVPAYSRLTKERFERCLDLYLAPRVRKNRLNIDPASLLPKLPRPEELRPFPTTCQTVFRGHLGRVRSVSVSPCGMWLASGGDDGTMRVWDLNGHQEWQVKVAVDEAVDVVRWRPCRDAFILAAAAGEEIFLAVPPCGGDAVESASRELLDAGFGYAATSSANQGGGADGGARSSSKEAAHPAGQWSRPGARLEQAGVLLRVTVRSGVKWLSWHRRGDHFCTVSPRGQRSSVAIHTLSRHRTQIPFRRLAGLAQAAQFHPSRPLFFVATQRAVRCYDLQRQELVRVARPGARWVSCLDVHPGGDNMVVGSYDRRVAWHDLDLSAQPYKTMRFHTEAVRAVRFHCGGIPLLADASDDGTVQIFHARVAGDLMRNPSIVPVKVLRGHTVVDRLGVLDLDWHPRLPWCVSAGADGTCRLWA